MIRKSLVWMAAVFILTGSSFSTLAQDFGFLNDKANASITYEAPRGMEEPAIGSTPSSDPEVAMTEYDLGYKFKPFIGEGYTFTYGIDTKWNRFKFEDAGLNDIDAYAVGIPLRGTRRLTEDWRLMSGVSPQLATDFTDISGDDFTVAAFLLGFYRFNDDLTGAIGAVYSREFGDDRLYPGIGALWNFAEDWQLRIIFPRPGVTYTPTDNLKFAIGLFPSGGKWNIEDPREDGSNEQYDFKFKGWRLGAGVEYALNKDVTLEGDVGMVVRREITIENDSDTVVDSDVDNGPGVRLGVKVKL